MAAWEHECREGQTQLPFLNRDVYGGEKDIFKLLHYSLLSTWLQEASGRQYHCPEQRGEATHYE
jgi:hypothetical protein